MDSMRREEQDAPTGQLKGRPMPNKSFPRAVSGMKGRLSCGRAPGGARGAASKRRPQDQPCAATAGREARDVGASQRATSIMAVYRLEVAVIEMQIDNIHLELDTQTDRTARLEARMTALEDTLHELMEVVQRLQDEVGNKRAPVDDISHGVFH
jgi:hypothetical protein